MKKWMQRLIDFTEKRIDRFREEAIFQPNDFELAQVLKENFGKIEREYLQYEKQYPLKPIQEMSPVQKDLTSEKQNWKALFLYGYNQPLGDYGGAFQETMKMINSRKEIVSAFYSVLEPGAELPVHTGKYKGLLRAQIGVKTPNGENQGLEVDGQKINIAKGEVGVFDDTFPHRAWNLSSGARVVFIVDFLRPLPFFLSMLNTVCIWAIGRSDYVKSIKENMGNG